MRKTIKKIPIFSMATATLALLLILNILPIQVTAATVTAGKSAYTLEDFSPIPLGSKYTDVSEFQHGVAFYTISTDEFRRFGKMGLIDTSGKEVTGPVFDYQFGYGRFQDGLALVMDGRYCGYINPKGEIVIPFSKKYVGSNGFFEGLAQVRYEYDSQSPMATKIGYMDKTGKVVIPYQYGMASDFSDGLAAVANNNSWGYINKAGKTVIPFEYSHASNFSNGYAVVSKEIDGVMMETIIDKTGKNMVPYTKQYGNDNNNINEEYRRLTNYYIVNGENDHVYEHYTDYIIRKTRWSNGQTGMGAIGGFSDYVLLDKQKNRLTQDSYGEMFPFSGGFAVVNRKKGQDGNGLIDKHGNEALWVANGTIRSFSSDGHSVMYKGGEWFVLTSPLADRQATPNNSKVLVNGQQTTFDAYNINGSNYFKLRDLAYALNGSSKQFDVVWDSASNAILLTTNKGYTSVGDEMDVKGAGDKTAKVATSKILLDGKEISLTAYNIGGNNYFKLRDIGQAFDFSVTWDSTKNTISIDTTNGYTE